MIAGVTVVTCGSLGLPRDWVLDAGTISRFDNCNEMTYCNLKVRCNSEIDGGRVEHSRYGKVDCEVRFLKQVSASESYVATTLRRRSLHWSLRPRE